MANDDYYSLNIYFRELKKPKYKSISYEKMVELFKRIESGDEQARNEVIERNLHLVVKLARKYFYEGSDLLENK